MEPVCSECAPHNSHLIALCLVLRTGRFVLLVLQPPQQVLADSDRGPQLGPQLLRFISQRVAQHVSGGLRSVPLGQRGAKVLDLLVLHVFGPLPDALQVLLLLTQLLLQPLDLLQKAGQDRG